MLPLYSPVLCRACQTSRAMQGELITLIAMAATLLSVLFASALYIQLTSAVYTPAADGVVLPVRNARQSCVHTALH